MNDPNKMMMIDPNMMMIDLNMMTIDPKMMVIDPTGIFGENRDYKTIMREPFAKDLAHMLDE